jgi:hypothetical protein
MPTLSRSSTFSIAGLGSWLLNLATRMLACSLNFRVRARAGRRDQRRQDALPDPPVALFPELAPPVGTLTPAPPSLNPEGELP